MSESEKPPLRGLPVNYRLCVKMGTTTDYLNVMAGFDGMSEHDGNVMLSWTEEPLVMSYPTGFEPDVTPVLTQELHWRRVQEIIEVLTAAVLAAKQNEGRVEL